MNKEWVQVILTESQLDLLQKFNVIRGSENEAYILCLGQFFKFVHNGFGEVEYFYATEFVIPDNTRVKFLNRDDIEELGWTYMGKHWFYHEDEYYRMDNDEFGAYYIHVHHPADSFGEITILYGDLEGYSLEGSVRKFDGAIRNYNDLKTIMKWAGIK